MASTMTIKVWENPHAAEPHIEESTDKRFYRCPECGEWVEYANKEDVFLHMVHEAAATQRKPN